MTITKRIDAITGIPPEYLREDPPAPRSVKIELSGRCNYRCGFCALRMREHQPTEDMDLDKFKRWTGQMREAGVEEIGLFFLGESFMNTKLLLEACRYVKQELRFPYVFLTSNASLADGETVWQLMRAGLDSLKWSVNAADEQQFAEIMGVKPALYRRALKNIKLAKFLRDDGGYKCGLYASSIRYDGEQQKRMEAMLAEHVIPYVDEHYWLPLYSMGAFATQREEELGYKPIAGNQGRLGALRDPLPCWSAFTEGHLTSSGKLSACCFDAGEKWVMADLNDVTFMQGWTSTVFQELRAAHLRHDVTGTICESCVAYKS